MRKTHIWTFAIAALLLMGLLAAGCATGKPKLELPQTQHDLGEIRQGEVVTVTFPVRNVGEKDLRIESVTTSCGCTSATVEPMVIPPQGEATLTVQYDSGLHPDEGPIWRIVYIATDDPETPEAQVEIRANVVAP